MKKINTLLLFLLASLISFAQNIEYNKRKNVFEFGDKKIAQLDAKSNGFGMTRSFFVKDMSDGTLISFLSHTPQDTLWGNYHSWYEVIVPSMDLHFTMDDPKDINNEKFFANSVIIDGLIDSNGALVKQGLQTFASRNLFNHEAAFVKLNDSLKTLVAEPFVPSRRDLRKPVVADDMYRIGHGDDIIGSWSMRLIPSSMPNASPSKEFIIKNKSGRIIAICAGGDLTIFGKRKEKITAFPSNSIGMTTNESPVSYMTRTAYYLVSNGYL
jgi:hypothetical protein